MRDNTVDRRTVLAGAGTLTITALAGCTGGDDDDADADEVLSGTQMINVGTNDNPLAFAPNHIRIEPGTTIEFVWQTDNHNIEVDEQPDGADWEGYEDIEDSGFEYEHTFDVAGVYEIACGPHRGSDMFATIEVVDE